MATQEIVRDYIKRISFRNDQEKIKCPACSPNRRDKRSKTLSVKIDGDDAVYMCHHCLIKGVVKIVDDAVAPEDVLPSTTSSLSVEHLSWLGNRSISPETADKCGLTEGRIFVRGRGEEVSCIGFPYQNLDGS